MSLPVVAKSKRAQFEHLLPFASAQFRLPVRRPENRPADNKDHVQIRPSWIERFHPYRPNGDFQLGPRGLKDSRESTRRLQRGRADSSHVLPPGRQGYNGSAWWQSERIRSDRPDTKTWRTAMRTCWKPQYRAPFLD